MPRVFTDMEKLIRTTAVRTLDMLKTSMDLSWLNKKDYRVIQTEEELQWVKCEMQSHRLLGVDTETTGLNICSLSRDNPLRDELVGICISWERNQGVYLPVAHKRFENLDKRHVFDELGELFETKTVITHNGLFDGKVFYSEGCRLNICHDTMLMAFNIDSRVSKGSKGLKFLTIKRYGYPVIEFSDIFPNATDYSLFQYLDLNLVQAYACADADHTLSLFLDMFSELLPCQMHSYVHDIRAQNELIRSEYYGKGLDLQLIQTLNEVNTRDMAKLEDIIFRYTGRLLNHKYGIDQDSVHVFGLGSSDELVRVLVNELDYPVKKHNSTGKISIDKHVLRALADEKATVRDEIFDSVVQGDILSTISEYNLDWISKDDKVLIEYRTLLKGKYKLAILIQKWRKLEKLRSSFFNVLLNNNYEGKYYSPILMTRAETARIIDPMQTLVGHLKRLIVPYDSAKQYMLDFDFAQIEYRTMAGESHVKWLVSRLNHPEADFHREGGSLILGKAPEDITKDERKSLKSVNFGIPYGMSAKGIMENRYGIDLSEEDRKKYLAEIEDMLVKWNDSLHEIRDYLNKYRAEALVEVPQERLPWSLKGQHVSRIFNSLGRSRVFDVSNLNRMKAGSIRRQAGNFPIQSYARELYVQAFTQFCKRCVKDGLMDKKVPDESTGTGYRFENKVTIMAYIHDECLMAVDADVNPYYLYKLIYEECMLVKPGHPRYFCGINITTNWYEGHAVDKYEAPVRFVEEKIQNLTEKDMFMPANPLIRDVVLKDIGEYFTRRIRDEVNSIYPMQGVSVVDFRALLPKFKSYFLKPKLFDFGKTRRSVGKQSWDLMCALLETSIQENWGVSEFIYPDNTQARLDSDGVIVERWETKIPAPKIEIVAESSNVVDINDYLIDIYNDELEQEGIDDDLEDLESMQLSYAYSS